MSEEKVNSMLRMLENLNNKNKGWGLCIDRICQKCEKYIEN